ncbi:hypothetical protein HDU87_000991 [Geranomyces variabilis]|uniref:NAD(P)-binding protein n=1 Tax=Geranomyces variabilis TaxID=109894 RepID=A0AAD5XJ72_9FUNG|nr:hypothetical protein HDU87_000991 [Geranomyces variabilis]
MTTSTTYLVAGASRGLGLGFASTLAARANTVVFATARDPSSATELAALAKKHSNVHVLKLETTSESDAAAAAAEIKRLGHSHLDVVIVNAGVGHKASVLETSLDDLLRIYKVNVGGVLVSFKAFYPLLKAGAQKKFVAITSILGSNGLVEKFGQSGNGGYAAYGASKAAVNHIVGNIAIEHKDLVALPIHPGHVATDMGGKDAPVSVKESIDGMLKVIDGAAAADTGKYFSYDGTTIPW